MVLGLPADIANGTNRIAILLQSFCNPFAILLQSVVGVIGYDKY